MKKALLFLVCVVFSLENFADTIGLEQAQQIASQFMSKTMPSVNGKRKVRSAEHLTYKDLGYRHLWTFADEANGGFVIVANNDCVNPVLAYSETDYLDVETLPDALKQIFLGYEQQMNCLAVAGYTPPARASEVERKVIPPLIETQWEQYPPYSYRLPYDYNASHPTLVGCVAVTLADLMYYYKYPAGTTKTIPAYTTATKGYQMEALPPTTFHYEKMHLNYYSISGTDEPDRDDESLQEVTKLLLYCGCALKMDYSFGGSAAVFDIETIADFFDFDRGARRRYAANYSHEVWEQMVYDELEAGRPVPYSSGAVMAQNHIFIVDGYDGNGYFHANYGQGGGQGSNSIYCDLGVLDFCRSQINQVWFSGYNILQSAFFGFQPNKGNAPAEDEEEANISESSHVTVDKVSYHTPFVNERLKVFIDYTNNGTNYENRLFLWIDGELYGGVGVYTDPGQSGQTIIFTSAPDKGSHDVKISSDWDGKNVLYSDKMEITDEPACKLEFEISRGDIDRKGYLHGSLNIKIKVKNVGEKVFDNVIYTCLDAFKCDDKGNYIEDEANGYPTTVWSDPYFLYLKPNESKEIEYTVDCALLIEDHIRYIPIIFYYNQGNTYQIFGKNYVDGFYYSSEEVVDVTDISLNKNSLTLNIGETATLTATVLPENASDKEVKWTSSDKTVASVDSNGKVTAKYVGKAVIKVESLSNPDVVASCEVTVVQPVTGVTLDATSIQLEEVGATYQLTATVLPEDASNKSVAWSTSDKSVCTVSKKGLVTAVGSGTATITVTTEDGGMTATCEVTVTITVSSITLNAETLEMQVGETSKLKATVLPDNATDKSVKWTSSDKTVASVDSNGKVTAKKAGKAVIKVESLSNPDVVASCEVTVVQPVTGVTLDATSIQLEEVGATYQLTATVLPEDASNKSVTWSTSDKSVCTVSKKGLVTAVGSGTATITVTTEDGGMTATCEVTVVDDDGILVLKTENMQNVRAVYDITGRKVEGLGRGLNIVQLNDGTTKKVMVK